MQITQKQLITHLKQILSPLYLLSGDEPLLLQETRDEIIKAAKSHEFSEKETFYIDSGFQIEKLIESVCNGSLFSTKKIIDIRNAAAKIDTVFITFLQDYFAHGTNDRVIIISTDKLSAAQQKAEWYELIKQHGVIIPIWPIRSNELPAWIIERAKEFQLTFSIDVAQMLAHFSEGNILSAQQALEKLSVLYPNAAITREQLITVLFDHARFGIFDLSESIMTNNPKKIMRILTRLEQTGEEPTLVLWAICRKLRENSASDKAKKALQKAARVDEIIKGARIGNVWQALTELCL
ncbi:MAG TPA: DNA polymerase III subunit delta [Coxiellaceae bacterium]|nr:MAG: DNA polymerase III subunit delta [Gammaproteobacteria bacterium RIFCSPHIGHO2_12_FULL_36_30]HLB56817.1 DNA polymerase III subunit delta [Coxiellaceae bacterium]